MAELFDAITRANTIADRLVRATSGATSRSATSSSGCRPGEIGSSTMPHKVNPIDFENAEGNFGLANALLTHMSAEAAGAAASSAT